MGLCFAGLAAVVGFAEIWGSAELHRAEPLLFLRRFKELTCGGSGEDWMMVDKEL
jgi:hypothetical protein